MNCVAIIFILDSILGVGLTFIVKALGSNKNQAHVREGAMGPNCVIFLIIVLFFTLLAMLFTNFRARKSIGVYMILLYGLFLLYSILCELEVMHPYGTDHWKT